MGYEPGYESYEPYEYDPYQQGGGEQQRYPEQQYQERQPHDPYRQRYPEQYGEQYPQPEQYQQPGQYQEYQQPQYQDAQWAQSGLGWERRAWDEARLGVSPLQEYEQEYAQHEQDEQHGEYQQYEEHREHEDRAPRRAGAGVGARPGSEAESELPRQRPRQTGSGAAQAGSAASAAAAQQAGGAFGAAGIGVVAAVCALASSGALLVAIALIQAGIAYGWHQAITLKQNGRPDRRAVVLTALIGWAASASAFRLPLDEDFLGLPVALGVGFLLLAADQTLRSRPLGDGERVAGLDLAVTGGLFAVLPTGFVVAERSDTALTASCALAAAVGVLCCALLGRDPLRGIVGALVCGAGIGAVAARSLTANGGLQAGGLGGAVAALGAAAALGALDRIAAEGGLRGSTRIVAQVLPSSLAAMGALFASAVFR